MPRYSVHIVANYTRMADAFVDVIAPTEKQAVEAAITYAKSCPGEVRWRDDEVGVAPGLFVDADTIHDGGLGALLEGYEDAL